MRNQPVPHKRTHLKHPKNHAVGKEQLWLRRFWFFFASFTLLSIALVAYNKYGSAVENHEDAYINIELRTVVGDSNRVICKLSLLIDPEQETPIKNRQKELEAVVSSVLAEAYQGAQRPPLTAVRELLHNALNQQLPRKLEIRDVLIQELLVGNS